MTLEQKNKLDNLNLSFDEIHKELIDKKEYNLASKLSKVYYEAQSINYVAGVDFIKNIYKL